MVEWKFEANKPASPVTILGAAYLALRYVERRGPFDVAHFGSSNEQKRTDNLNCTEDDGTSLNHPEHLSPESCFMLTRRSVLLVEDDGDLRVILAAILLQTGYQVRTAWDGVSALLEIETGMPDIIVSDLNMPRMSGFELLTTIRSEFPSIPLIAISGAYSGNQVPEGVTADAFYEKGTHPIFLLGLVSAMTQSSASVAGRA